MPSLTYTPGILTLTPGTFIPEPVRFTFDPAVLALAGGDFAIGAQFTATDGKRLPRLQRPVSYFDQQGRPTEQMQGHWQRFAERIEARFGNIEDVLVQIQQAQATAAAANQAVQVVAARIDLAASYTDPTAVLTASSAGAVTIAAHDRVYDNGTRVAVNSGSLSGFTSGQFIRVYYVDAARSGGAVAYQGTTDDITQSGDTHVVGGIQIPAAGEADSTGAGTVPPGYIPDFFLPFAI